MLQLLNPQALAVGDEIYCPDGTYRFIQLCGREFCRCTDQTVWRLKDCYRSQFEHHSLPLFGA